MRHFTAAILLFFTFSSFGHPAKSFNNSDAKTKIETELYDFLKIFELNVKQHNSDRVMQCMNIDFLDIQLKGMLNGNVEQFLNEFFCGDNIKTGAFECAKFQTIKKLKRQMIIHSGSDEFEVVYTIIGKGFKIKTDWVVSSKKEGQKTIFGLVGAMG